MTELLVILLETAGNSSGSIMADNITARELKSKVCLTRAGNLVKRMCFLKSGQDYQKRQSIRVAQLRCL